MVQVLVIDGNARVRNRVAKSLRAAGYAVASDNTERAEGVPKNLHAAALGRLGGLVGGRVRAARLSPRERCAIARKAARARWARARSRAQDGGRAK